MGFQHVSIQSQEERLPVVRQRKHLLAQLPPRRVPRLRG